jgi:hypothetical protein
MTTIIESRASWGARAPKVPATALASTRGVKAHYTGGHVDPATLTDHLKCEAAVRGIQGGHMDGNGWNDIGYTGVVCNHQTFMIGRGKHALPAANGPGLNSGHYAVLFLVGTSGVTEPTDAMKLAWLDAREYLRNQGDAGREIKGHRDGYATDCPGEHVYAWIRAGAPKPDGTPPATPHIDEPEVDMQLYSAFGLDPADAYDVPAGVWVDVKFRTEFADPDDDHITGLNATILKGDPSVYSAEFGATFTGLDQDDVVYVRTAEFLYSAGPPAVDNLVEEGEPTANIITGAGTVHHSAVGNVQEGRKLRFQVRHEHTGGVVQIVRARARLDHRK